MEKFINTLSTELAELIESYNSEEDMSDDNLYRIDLLLSIINNYKSIQQTTMTNKFVSDMTKDIDFSKIDLSKVDLSKFGL